MEDLVNPIETEVIEPVIETPEVETEVVETPVEPVKEKPWAGKQKTPEHIPYGRFKEVNDKYRDVEKQLDEERRIRQELESKLNAPKKSIESTGDKAYDDLVETASKYGIEAPDINEFETMAEFNRAERKFQAELAELKAELKYNQLREQETIKAEVDRVNNDFMAKAEEVKASIPDLNEAFDYFRQFSSMIPTQIQKAISTHPNGPELLYELVSNEENLVKMIDHPNNPYFDPVESQVMIRMFKSKLNELPKINETVINPTNAKPVIPGKVKGSTSNVNEYNAKSMAEYRAARRK